MPNNVKITVGDDENIATQDVAGVQYQEVKLVDGTDQSTTPIRGDGNGAMLVSPQLGGAAAATGAGAVDNSTQRVVMAADSPSAREDLGNLAAIAQTLDLILQEMRVQSILMAQIAGVGDDLDDLRSNITTLN